jgi:hypothetical protein
VSDLTPSRTITIADKDYALDGSFSTLRAIQEHFKLDIVQVLLRIGNNQLPTQSVADLIAIESVKQKNADVIGQAILDEYGLLTIDCVSLKTQLTAWLTLAITPKGEREKKSQEMQKIIDGLKTSPSPGGNTANSA